MSAEIEVTGISKQFGQGSAAFKALSDINLTIDTGEFFTLLGPSGCGKTTLLRVIAGFEAPTTGSLRINGEEVASKGPNQRPVNTVFQSYALFPHMTVAQNIAFGLKMLGKPRAEVETTTVEMLRLVRMEAMAGRKPSEISGGQQQRVALARALAPRPRVLLLDEPSLGLAPKITDRIYEIIRDIRATGVTVLVVEQNADRALKAADRTYVLNGGCVRLTGTAAELAGHPEFEAAYFGLSGRRSA